MDAVFVACVECDASLGSVFNLWNRIGKRHLTPAIFRPEDLQLFLSGPVRPGVEDTLVTEWYALRNPSPPATLQIVSPVQHASRCRLPFMQSLSRSKLRKEPLESYSAGVCARDLDSHVSLRAAG